MKLTLRALEPEDLDLLYAVENDRGLWNVGLTNVPYSRYVLHEYIANATGDIYTDKQVRLVMVNEEGESVGLADLTNFSPQHLRAEVGIVVCEPYRRRGYGLAALQTLQDYAAHTLHLHQLYALVPADNAASLGLFARAGFQSASELREWLFDGKAYRDVVLVRTFL